MKKTYKKQLPPHLLLNYPGENKFSHDELEQIDKFTDEDIARQVTKNPDAAPILDEWPEDIFVHIPANKIAISIRVDPDVLRFFKKDGKGHLSRMHAVLRSYVDAMKEK